jgi:hypothetical protein
LYAAIPGRALQQIVDELQTVVSANLALAEYHQSRRQQFSTV